ncbi:MAG: enoyl-CoA hydratase/isomerase family protein [Chloroflexi bacterium]|nr:enoyl-CoA hydratase/isomerase family protein [Chloroflexota bacterium]
MPHSHVLLGRSEGIATLTLNEPEKRNPLSPQLVGQLLETLAALRADGEARVLIVTGAGPAFCAGADIRRFRVMTPMEDREEYNDIVRLIKGLLHYPKPVIAAVNGYALGGGCGLVAACDLAIAADSARFGKTEINIGLFPGATMAVLARSVNRKGLFRLAFTGDIVDAQEALRLGLVNWVVPASRLMDEARSLARRLVEKSATALAFCKEVVNMATELDLDQAIDRGRDLRVLGRTGRDAAEGAAAFLEKRPPRWE